MLVVEYGRNRYVARASRNAGKAPQTAIGSRQAILDAALRTFARNGYDGASIPGIAKLAGVAPPLIHYYFETKEKLWREAVEHSLGELRSEASAVLRATRSLSPLDRLRTLLQVYAEFAARCPDHFSMIVAEARADSDRFAWLQENYTGLLFEEVVSILSDARDAGLIRDVPLKDLAVVLIGGILVHFTIYPTQAAQPAPATVPTGFVEFLFDMLTRGVTA
jgi:AcrR family transcriptional regulator